MGLAKRLARLWLPFAVILLLTTPALAADTTAFGFNAKEVSGLSGPVRINGGGVFDPAALSGHLAGGFTCDGLVPHLGDPMTAPSCEAGQGVRWDTPPDGVKASTQFRCNTSEIPMTATTGPDLVVLHADFYRAIGGPPGASEEFTSANMIVSSSDIDPNLDGVQNVWIQGVGCGTAVGNVR